ncbi:MAG TPA: Rieske 2Fe-2S domain-containing protein, partial [Stellaceae bacterium]|nr:Rieske 2Fe-2S domain-containing protein [Stellaceae bacterium]
MLAAMRNDEPLIAWPKEGPTRAPYRVMHDPDIYRAEMDRIFRGPTWHYLCLDAELPKPGDYRTSFIGEVPIIVARDEDGEINAMVNRCAHKGALLCIEPCGNRKQFACVYHAWTYSLKGDLTSVAFQRGLAGKGGMPADFDPKQHGLARIRVENFCGMVFGTFSDTVENVETYLGPDMAAHVRRIFNRPVEVLGYY